MKIRVMILKTVKTMMMKIGYQLIKISNYQLKFFMSKLQTLK